MSRVVILGLTGSIGMGKTTAAEALRRLGIPVHDADAAVHALLGHGGKAVAAVERLFPGVTRHGAIDRRALGARVFSDGPALKQLESILHPLARHSADRFLAACARRRARLAVLDIPLLFETGAGTRCDKVAVVSAPPFLQRQRVLRRPAMSEQRLRQILARQMADRDKRRRADFVVLTGLDRRRSLQRLQRIVRRLRGRRGKVWRAGYKDR